MFTGNIEFNRLIYQVEKVLKSYTVYGLVRSSSTQRNKISNFVRLEPFRGKSDTQGTNLILRGRDATKWAKKTITGLRPLGSLEQTFYGDHRNGNKNLMLFQIHEETMIIDYFNGFYPYNPNTLYQLVRNHKFYFLGHKKGEVC